MLRKALVSDLVHGFCYACRTHEMKAASWPSAILGLQLPARMSFTEFKLPILLPFIAYAHTVQDNYWVAQVQLSHLSLWLSDFSDEETAYALYLMDKYYHGYITKCDEFISKARIAASHREASS